MDLAMDVVDFLTKNALRALGTSILLLVLVTIVYVSYSLFVYPSRCSVRHVPGPARDDLLYGNMQRVLDDEPGVVHTQWQEEYGGAVRYHGILGGQRLVLFDPTALNHVLLSKCYSYPKPEEVRGDLEMILGRGVLFAEGEDHRRQRRILQPAFSPARIRELTPTFFEHAYRLRTIWTEMIERNEDDDKAFASPEAATGYRKTKREGEVTLDIMPWLSRVALDIIGMTSFGYDFGSLERSNDALADAFLNMFVPHAVAKRPTPRDLLLKRTFGILVRYLPVLKFARYVPIERVQNITRMFETLEGESRKIIASKQGMIEKEGMDSLKGSKDLIALLLKSASDDAKMKLTDEELRGQLTTFAIAGHETGSVILTWTLWTLSERLDVQQWLRDEIRQAKRAAQVDGNDEIESDALHALPYLDAVMREMLRLEAPVSATMRQTSHDDVIPLSKPIQHASDPSKTISHIQVEKGQTIFIPITAVNRSKEVFGADADEFRPERWLGDKAHKIDGKVGVWASMLTFLAGPRSCIGYRFALLEVKAILATLIDAFEILPRDPPFHVERRSDIVTRPLVVGEELLGYRMPLRIRLAKPDVPEE
ncbi:hypothetical protein JCM10212_002894 [Sporobolomyces blumeae]